MSNELKVSRLDTKSKLYIPASFFLIRTSYNPLELFSKAFDSHSLEKFLFNFFHDNPIFREALAVASFPLYHKLITQKESFNEKENRQIVSSLLKYYLRMTTRTIPFGLFSFVAMGRWGNVNSMKFDLQKVRKRSRPDMLWIYNWSKEMINKKELFPSLSVKLNPLVLLSKNRIHLFFAREQSVQNRWIDKSPLVEEIVKNISQFESTRISDLSNRILKRFPQDGLEKILNTISSLIKLEFLNLELLPSLLTNSVFDDMIDSLDSIRSYLGDDFTLMKELQSDLSEYDKQDIGCSEPIFLEMEKKISRIAQVSVPVQVDSFYMEEDQTLSGSIADELQDAVDFLWKINSGTLSSSFTKYHLSFLNKYGTNRLVPLLELLDENFGLGLPEHYISGVDLHQLEEKWETWLQRKWEESLLCRQQEILLDDQIFTLIPEPIESEKNKGQASLDIFFEVLSDSTQSIESGDFQLMITNHTWQGGATFGRFLDLFGEGERELLVNFYREEESLEKQCQTYGSSYFPSDLRDANVSSHPHLRGRSIDLGAGGKDISLSEIYVGATLDRFILQSKGGDKEIAFKIDHLLHIDSAPTPLRFLRDASLFGKRLLFPFSWGRLSESRFLPRVRYKKTIFCPAQWIIDRFDLNIEAQHSIDQVVNKLLDWKDRWRIPRYVFLVEADQKLLFDMSHPMSLKEMVNILKKKGRIKLQEKVRQEIKSWIKSSEGSHLSEFVLPFIKNSKYVADPSVSLFSTEQVPLTKRWKMPGSEWLYVKFYMCQESENQFLLEQLVPMTGKLKNNHLLKEWFFIRYHDGKNHLRVRFHFIENPYPVDLLQEWFESLMEGSWVSDIQISCYEREMERYGGEEIIEEMESLFCADSQTAIQMIGKNIPLPKFVIGAVSLIHLLKQFGFHFEGQISFLEKVAHGREHLEGFREWKEVLFREIQMIEECEFVSSPIFVKLESLNRQRKLTNSLEGIVESLVHMHLNRLFFLDKGEELKACQFALHSLTSWVRMKRASISSRNQHYSEFISETREG